MTTTLLTPDYMYDLTSTDISYFVRWLNTREAFLSRWLVEFGAVNWWEEPGEHHFDYVFRGKTSNIERIPLAEGARIIENAFGTVTNACPDLGRWTYCPIEGSGFALFADDISVIATVAICLSDLS